MDGNPSVPEQPEHPDQLLLDRLLIHQINAALAREEAEADDSSAVA